MPAAFVFLGLLAVFWGVWKLGKPWRRYHSKHIAPLEEELVSAKARYTEAQQARAQAIADAALFTRDFRAEVRKHQKAKNTAYEILNPLRERKSSLHDEMKDVRASLDSWHRSSKSFFGNKGRKIKDDSVLGWFGLEQTVSQKESLERRRDNISSEIRSLKHKISGIYELQIKPAKEGLKAAFDDEKRLRRLRQEGLNERHFRSRKKELDAAIAAIDIEIAQLTAAIADVKDRYGKTKAA
ncbi:hypothetical protein AB9K35_17490 [Leisingera sp. XS_AS12]|uniref:hypothetical protein n=1 Tax=Leisingera sp. XS_AS12 TaxID=3241294 RepID=UPI003517CB84